MLAYFGVIGDLKDLLAGLAASSGGGSLGHGADVGAGSVPPIDINLLYAMTEKVITVHNT